MTIRWHANIIDSNVRVFSKVDVDSASVGRNMYGFNRYLSTKESVSFAKALCGDWHATRERSEDRQLLEKYLQCTD